MKHIFTLFFVIIISSSLFLFSCTTLQEPKPIIYQDTEDECNIYSEELIVTYENEPIFEEESIIQNEDENNNIEIDKPKENEIITYKGIDFIGMYKGAFFIDKDFLYDGGANNLYQITHDLAIAFISANVEKIYELIENDEMMEYQQHEMKWRTKSELDHLLRLSLESIILNYQDNDVDFYVQYIAAFNYDLPYDHHSRWVSMTMKLNDDGKWKTNGIRYTP